MKILNFAIIFLSLPLIIFFSSFFTGGCAKGPFEVDTPTPTPTPLVTPTAGPTEVPQRVYEINVILLGNLEQNRAFYIFAFNRPNPVNETEADPISTNSDFWTDYISFGPLESQDSDFVRRERLLVGDIASLWNPTQFAFTTGTAENTTIQIILPLETFDNPEDLYFNFVTTDSGGVPRDALGFGLGSTVDSLRLNELQLNTPLAFDDTQGDVVNVNTLPENVNPEILDIISGEVILKDI